MWLYWAVIIHLLCSAVIVSSVDLFTVPGKKVESTQLKKEKTDEMTTKDWVIEFWSKDQNPQFGYAVALFKGTIDKNDSGVVVSAPGNPNITFIDTGFAEIHMVHKLDDEDEKADIIVRPAEDDKQRYFAYHSLFGHSLAIAPVLENFFLYFGAPQGATCETTLAIDSRFLKSFDSYGHVFFNQYLFSSRRSTTKLVQVTSGDQDLMYCKTGEGFDQGDARNEETKFAEKAEGFAQINRNLLGFSTHFTKDGMFVLSGAPMSTQQTGYVLIFYRKFRSIEDRQFDQYIVQNSRPAFYLCPERIDPYKKRYDIETDTDLRWGMFVCEHDQTYGYSLTSLNTSDGYYVAVGGPRAAALHGRIKLFKINLTKDFTTMKADTFSTHFNFLDPPLKGSGFNTGFGTVLAGADLDGDGSDELIVGEPYFTDPSSDTYNSGRVLIYQFYIKSEDGRKGFSYLYSIPSPKPTLSNMFGFSIVSFGDMDLDGGDDLLIGALVEKTHGGKGRGKVYLFSGRTLSAFSTDADDAETPTAVQEFTDEESDLFGFSIGESRADLDGNGLNDLVIGDPGKKAQFARVYFAKTFVRLLHPDSIPPRLFFTVSGVNDECPESLKTDEVNFCQKFELRLENRGFMKFDWVYPTDAPKRIRWDFNQSFTVEVEVNEKVNPKKPSKLKVFGRGSVEFGPKKSNDGIVTAWVYGVLQTQVFGETINVIAETKLKDGDSIVLNEKDTKKIQIYKNTETVLAPDTFGLMDVAIGDLFHVEMDVTPALQEVVLGSPSNELNLTVEFTCNNPTDPCYFINGELLIRLSTSQIGYTTVVSDPPNLLSCSKTGDKINCNFYSEVTFKQRAKAILTVLVDELVSGEVPHDRFDLAYVFTWANDVNSRGKLSKSSTIQLKYHAALNVEVKDAYVIENTVYRPQSALDYAVVFRNERESRIGKIELQFYFPIYEKNEAAFEIGNLPESCVEKEKVDAVGKCSTPRCTKYTCSYTNLYGNNFQRTLSIQVIFHDSVFWDKLVREKETLNMLVHYEITDANTYKIKLEKDHTTVENPTASVVVRTRIQADTAEFPWWIVLLTLVVTSVIVLTCIILLFQRGFFTKRDLNKLNDGNVNDEDGVAEDGEMMVTSGGQNFSTSA